MARGLKQENRNRGDKKLTKVLSTKVSADDYNRFRKYANLAFESGLIKEPKPSTYLRYIVTYPFNERGLH